MKPLSLPFRLPACLAACWLLFLAAPAGAQQAGLTIADALDDPGGQWSGGLVSSPQQAGWMAVAGAEAHDGVDALRFSRTIYGAFGLSRQLPGAGTAAVWWRRTGEQWGGHPLECALGGVPVLEYPLYGDWGHIFLSTSAPALLRFTERPNYQTSWLDEFSFAPAAAGASIGEVLDAPGLEIYAVSSGQPWQQAAGDAAPGAPANGCLLLPANVPGGMKIKVNAPGMLRWRTRYGPPGTAWQAEGYPILTVPAVVTVGRFLPQWLYPPTQQPVWDYPFFGYNSSSPFLAYSVDNIVWEPTTAVSLAEALDTTLPVTGAGWEGMASAALSPDGVDAALARSDGAVMSTTVTGPVRVQFTASHSTGPYLSTLVFSVDGEAAEVLPPGQRTIRYDIQTAGPHTLSWTGPAGARVDALSTGPLPPLVLTALNEALDAPQISFTHDAAADWTGRPTAEAADGVDAAFSPFLAAARNPQSWSAALTAQFTLPATARVSFQATFDQYYEGRYLLELDGTSGVFYAEGGAWSEVSLLVGPGTHTLRWLAIQSPGIYLNSPPPVVQRRLLLDRFTVATVGGPSPSQALEYPLGILPASEGSTLATDTKMTHDGEDSLRVTLAGPFLLRLGRSAVSGEYYRYLWVRTDAASGSVTVNNVVIAGGEWVPLVVFELDSIERGLTIGGPDGARVWLDEVRPVSSTVGEPEVAAEALDFPGVQFTEGYASYFGGPVAHDGQDVFSAGQSSGDDHQILELAVPVNGPATASFWWRVQRKTYGYGDATEIASAWVASGGARLSAILDVRYSGAWRQATVQVPAGAQTVSIFMRGSADTTTLFLDQFALSPPLPATTFAGAMAARGLTGADALPGADPDGDGTNNLAEFALNSDPSSASPAPIASLTFIPGHDGAPPAIAWRGLHPAALPYIALDIQASLDLSAVSWFSIQPEAWQDPYPRPPAFTTATDGTLTLAIPLQSGELPLNAPRLFFRGTLDPAEPAAP